MAEAKKIEEKVMTKEQVQEMIDKMKEPIILKSPLEYKPGQLVISELQKNERDQLMFGLLSGLIDIVGSMRDNMVQVLNSSLLLQMEIAKKMDIPAEKVIDGNILAYNKDVDQYIEQLQRAKKNREKIADKKTKKE